MNRKSFYRDLYAVAALAICVAICSGLIILLVDRQEHVLGFEENLKKLTTIFIGISGFVSAILMVYLATSALTEKTNRLEILEKISHITQQMHHFRNVAEILFRSNIWLPGLREYMEKEYATLSYFDVKEFHRCKSKLAIEFMQETHHFGQTENIYLELKSLLMTHPKEKRIPETIAYPISYDRRIVEKWAEHKCGSGLWYAFGYKYGNYKESLNLDAVYERHREKILTLANTIDHDAFEDSSFNEVFFGRLWEYLAKEVIPRLYLYQGKLAGKSPRLYRFLYSVFLLLIVFGVLLPLTYLMLSLSVLAVIVGYSVVISTIFYIAITFHVFLSAEVRS